MARPPRIDPRCLGCNVPLSSDNANMQRGGRYTRSRCKACDSKQIMAWAKTPAGVESLKLALDRWRKSDKGRSWGRLADKTRQHTPARVASQAARGKRYWATEKGRAVTANHRIKRRGYTSAGRVTAAEWRDIVLQHFGSCAYCFRSDCKLTMDHVIPLSVGGAHDPENIAPSCNPCNARKNNTPMIVFLAKRRLAEVA